MSKPQGTPGIVLTHVTPCEWIPFELQGEGSRLDLEQLGIMETGFLSWLAVN